MEPRCSTQRVCSRRTAAESRQDEPATVWCMRRTKSGFAAVFSRPFSGGNGQIGKHRSDRRIKENFSPIPQVIGHVRDSLLVRQFDFLIPKQTTSQNPSSSRWLAPPIPGFAVRGTRQCLSLPGPSRMSRGHTGLAHHLRMGRIALPTRRRKRCDCRGTDRRAVSHWQIGQILPAAKTSARSPPASQLISLVSVQPPWDMR